MIMGLATYAVIEAGDEWTVLHDGNVEGNFITKESAFEAAVAAASLAIREAHEATSVRRATRPETIPLWAVPQTDADRGLQQHGKR
jgi:hypothetical protein